KYRKRRGRHRSFCANLAHSAAALLRSRRGLPLLRLRSLCLPTEPELVPHDTSGLREAARHEQNDKSERGAINNEAQIANAAQHFGQQSQENRAEHRAYQSAHTADNDHSQDIEGLSYEKRVRHQCADETRIKAACRTANGSADTECENLPGRAVNAE